MPITLEWGKVGERTYEQGVDRVVVYLDDGTAVPWSGVVSITESKNVNASAVYFDGNKVNSIVETNSYSASISAITYPDEVSILEGNERINHGIYLTNQYARPFSMSYRTGVGDDINGMFSNYKIHILFGLMLTPANKDYVSINNEPSVMTFEWDISSIPPEVGNYRPTSHITLDENQMPEALKDAIYLSLYGDGTNPPEFSTVEDLIDQILAYSFWNIVDNNDGTFDATPFNTEDLELVNPSAVEGDADYDLYRMDNVDIEWLDDDTYLLINGHGETTACNSHFVGDITDDPTEDGDCYHLVRSALATNELAHYIGTAPLGSMEIQPVWKVTKITFGPPVSIVKKKNVKWTEREL